MRQSGVGRPVVPKARSAVPSVVMGLWMTQQRRLQPISSIMSVPVSEHRNVFARQAGFANRLDY